MIRTKRFMGLLVCLFLLATYLVAQSRSAQAGSASATFLPQVMIAPRGPNLLPNPSFEQGWYHQDDLPELQLPDKWQFAYAEGKNALDPDPWNEWVRPETRVLPSAFLPPDEHDLFIWDGDQTVKIFKGSGAISFELTTAVSLTPDTYILEINVFPDLVVGYDTNGQKIWAPDPLSGEVKLIAGNGTTGWILPTFGEKNRLRTTFTVSKAQTVVVGAAIRGRWAIQNNGWFMDDWWLYQQ